MKLDEEEWTQARTHSAEKKKQVAIADCINEKVRKK